jgi:hypothetical protein
MEKLESEYPPDTNVDVCGKALSNFLQMRNVKDRTPRPVLTHTSFAGGCYAIQDEELEEFHKLIAAHFSSRREDTRLSLVERHIAPYEESLSPIIIDLDFRMATLHRPYSINTITAFLDIIIKYLMEYIDSPKLKCYILEKQEPKEEKGAFKDGIHIIFPYIVTRPTLQYCIRDRFLREHATFFTSHMPTVINTPNDIYDESIIFKNGWMMYGSKKPFEPHRWLATMTYDGKLALPVANPYLSLYVSLFSIRNKRRVSPLTKSGHAAIEQYQHDICTPIINTLTKSSKSNKYRSNTWIMKHMPAIINLLSTEPLRNLIILVVDIGYPKNH